MRRVGIKPSTVAFRVARLKRDPDSSVSTPVTVLEVTLTDELSDESYNYNLYIAFFNAWTTRLNIFSIPT